MATLYDAPLSHFVIRKNQIKKKNPNLARILSFTSCYKLNIIAKYHKRNIVIAFSFKILSFVEKGPKGSKVGRKCSIQLTLKHRTVSKN